MPARGIFLKIYLCFWLVIILVVAAQVALDFAARTGPFREPLSRDSLERTVVPVLIHYGSLAREYDRSGNVMALERSAREFRDRSGVRAFLTDPSGRVVGPGEMPGEVESVARAARSGHTAKFSITKDRAIIAVPLPGNGEKGYFVVGEVSGHAPGHPGPGHGPPPPGKPGPPAPPVVFSPLFLIPPGDHPYPWIRVLTTLIISGGLCYLLARYLTAPIVKLRDAARRFVDGDLSVRITGPRARWKDEISGLNEDFNVIAERIEGLITQQRRLIRDISHELRSPLARLTIAAELIRRQGTSIPAATIDRIEKETAELNAMITQVLDISRFENNAGQSERSSLDLAGLLEEIIDDANFEAGSRRCSVCLVGEHGPFPVNANEEWLRKGIENVVRNAVRYTREGTSVEVSLEKSSDAGGDWARLCIRDYGDGVPPADLSHLFRPFYRVSNSRDRKSGGTGLGLAITERAVVGLHKGTVKAENAPGGGLMIVIRIPVAG